LAQAFVFVLAILKIFVICAVQSIDTETSRNNYHLDIFVLKTDENSLSLTIAFAYLIFGNICDNTEKHRQVLCVCELILGCLYLFCGIFVITCKILNTPQ